MGRLVKFEYEIRFFKLLDQDFVRIITRPFVIGLIGILNLSNIMV